MSLAQWVTDRLSEDDDHPSVKVIDGTFIVVDRPVMGSVVVAFVKSRVLDEHNLRSLVEKHPDVKYVVNIWKDACIMGDAYKLSEACGISFGSMGDLRAALRERDIADYVPPETRFRERIFRQHDQIASFERLDDSRYRLVRQDLPPVIVYICLDYEVTADGVRTAIDLYEYFDAYVTSNPNCTSISTEACAAAKQAGRKVLIWTHFMGALNSTWS